jgi:hypothetical protein
VTTRHALGAAAGLVRRVRRALAKGLPSRRVVGSDEIGSVGERAMRISESVLVALIALTSAAIGSAVGPFTDAFLRAHVLNDKMVELAVDILKSDCKNSPGLVPARKWAVDVISQLSSVKMGDDAKVALVQNSIAPGAFDSSFSADFDIARNPCAK